MHHRNEAIKGAGWARVTKMHHKNDAIRGAGWARATKMHHKNEPIRGAGRDKGITPIGSFLRCIFVAQKYINKMRLSEGQGVQHMQVCITKMSLSEGRGGTEA